MNKPAIVSLILCTSLAACATVDPEYQAAMQAEESREQGGRIVFYRGHSLQAKLADAYLGTELGYFLSLDEGQYARIEVPAGFHEFKVRAQGSVASNKAIKVVPGATVCVEARPNYEELEWLLVPFVNALIPSFVLEESACPDAAALGELAGI